MVTDTLLTVLTSTDLGIEIANDRSEASVLLEIANGLELVIEAHVPIGLAKKKGELAQTH